jgi:uncharacterized protein YndB with AHSA1/START domain
MDKLDQTVLLKRHFAAPVAKLFRAWSDPAYMRKWHAPGAMEVVVCDVDFRVGGHYRLVMQNSGDDGKHGVQGEYLEIVENSLIRFSWLWDGSSVTTEVELRFTVSGNGSELQLKHTQFSDSDSCGKHNQGWIGVLDNLAKFLDIPEGVSA